MREFLQLMSSLPPGDIGPDAATTVGRMLAECWDHLTGSGEGGMKSTKLVGRTEEVCWEPPLLRFKLERHGGTVNGSTKAELQHWVIDVCAGTAAIEGVKSRQIYAMDKPLKVEPLAEQLVAAVLSGDRSHPGLEWKSESAVQILVAEVIPATNRQTTVARRGRLMIRLKEDMAAIGWRLIPKSRARFERAQP
jgi:hypothetical protein